MKNLYYYDPQRCEFVDVRYKTIDRVIHTLTTWLLTGLMLGGLLIAVLFKIAGSPAEIALRAENNELLKQHKTHSNRIEHLSRELGTISEQDNEIYRSVLGMEPITMDERRAGSGGADIYSRFDGLSGDATSLLRETATNLETLEQRLQIQQQSLGEVQQYYSENREKMRHLPVMRPINTAILSGFGIRHHPVLRVRRMHEGLDFRATVGTPIYAPGDATVKRVGNRAGGYGLTIDLDHGYGYQTRYAHLSGVADNIRVGQKVRRGDVIGYTGRSGIVSGPHLHYEVIHNGRKEDPLQYLFTDVMPNEYRLYTRISQNTVY